MILFFIFLQAFTPLDIIPPPPEVSEPNIYLSEDQGECWAEFHRGLKDGDTANNLFELGNTLFLTTQPSGLYRMPLGEKERKWTKVEQGLPNDAWIATVARRGDHLVAASYEKGIYVSTNDGVSWRRPFFNLKTNVRSLYYHKDELLAATDAGVFASYDDGEHWQLKYKVYIINDFVEHQGRLLAIGQNRIGTFEGEEVNWSEARTPSAIRKVMIVNDWLYFRSADGDIYRTRNGMEWEEPTQKNYVNVPKGSLGEALFQGYQSGLRQAQFGKNVLISTSLGWVSIRRTGC